MIEQILTRKNLLQAMRQVQKNHGSAGVDHMPVTKLSELLELDSNKGEAGQTAERRATG